MTLQFARHHFEWIPEASDGVDVWSGTIQATGRQHAWNAETGVIAAVPVTGQVTVLTYDAMLLPKSMTPPGVAVKQMSSTAAQRLPPPRLCRRAGRRRAAPARGAG
ncbi:MAG: hypothetical protein Q8K82_01235 [Gemmatimonadaceae bacterium]|nr:hypothetical protein [Gemmatimonadaceae bacterium]